MKVAGEVVDPPQMGSVVLAKAGGLEAVATHKGGHVGAAVASTGDALVYLCEGLPAG